MTDRREHFYDVTFSDGTKRYVRAVPSELRKAVRRIRPKGANGSIQIVDKTMVEKWMGQ